MGEHIPISGSIPEPAPMHELDRIYYEIRRVHAALENEGQRLGIHFMFTNRGLKADLEYCLENLMYVCEDRGITIPSSLSFSEEGNDEWQEGFQEGYAEGYTMAQYDYGNDHLHEP